MLSFYQATLAVLIYFIIAVTLVVIIRLLLPVPREIFRKTLHFVLLGSIAVWLYSYSQWWQASLSAIAFALLVYPLLWALEHISVYSEFLTERKKGELKASLLYVFGMFAFVAAIGWGIFSDRALCLAAILAWGIGDAFAALIGKRFGRHHLEGALIDGKKSVEGTLAMFLSSFASVFLVLFFGSGMPWYACIATAAVTAAIAAVVELCSKNGMDTVFCPLASLAALIPMLYLFGGL